MPNKKALLLIAVLLLLSGMACNLSDLASVIEEQGQNEAAVAPATVVVEASAVQDDTGSVPVQVTREEVAAAPIDVEEQLVIDVYDRLGPAVVCITAPQRFGECIGSGFVIDSVGYVVT
ncbi:MAG: hypothetical protein PVF47_14340, partial [Anaerolineae bacterium]